MNREIKFRGKCISDGEWLFGDLMHDNNGGSYVYPTESEGLYKKNAVFPDTVGQYTGLKDKNGVEIYEGDILRSEGYAFRKDDCVPCYDIHEVVWDESNCAFSAVAWKRIVSGKEEQLTSFLYMLTDAEDCEVVGNVYDNPELIGRTKNE